MKTKIVNHFGDDNHLIIMGYKPKSISPKSTTRNPINEKINVRFYFSLKLNRTRISLDKLDIFSGYYRC